MWFVFFKDTRRIEKKLHKYDKVRLVTFDFVYQVSNAPLFFALFFI